MKYITYFIKFFYRIRFWLIIAPIIVASLVYWKTNNTPRDYTTTCSIYTGIITGVNILSESGVTMTSYTQGSMMDNLLNIITADQTLKQVSLRLYARIMVYGDPHKDNIYTQANNYRNLYNHGRPIHHLIDKKSDNDSINEQRTYENLLAYETNDPTNYVYGIYQWNLPYVNREALKKIHVKRLDNSDVLEVSYTTNDPGIAYQTVVILIDEYDKPMLQAIGNEELGEKYRDTLKGFYSVLKTMDGYIRFALLTGVTKFGKVSVFSDLNNLNDISMDEPYVELCGITEKEIHHYLEPEIRQLAKYQKMSYEDACRELKERYDGYHFTENSIGLYNPFSILNTFYKMKFGSYWFETGTPSYLVKLLLRDKYDLQQLAHDEATSDMLNCIDSTSKNPLPVIYQSGYLTIKGYDERFDIYRLGFPNREVEEGFIRYLLPFYANIDKGQTGFHITRFVSEVEQGDCDAFFRRLQSFFADTPYELVRDLELHYQNVLFIVYKLLGFYVQAEYHTSNGRIDMVLKTDRYIYVMEFKFDGSAEEALKQIEEKGYAVPFANDSRQLIKAGVIFSSKTRNIDCWVVD